ncbi:MAG: Gfo/Idh/MocA family oxidoreductase [Planctomycetaceae bacterium]
MPYWYSPQPAHANLKSALERPTMGCVGTGDRWNDVGGSRAMEYFDIVAVCDVDKNNVEKAKKRVKDAQGRDADAYEDYRKVIERDDIDTILCVTTDHWHTKVAIEAMKAGKDVYCEKPLTLTIEEGKLINKVQKETGRVFQVGTQQRSEMGLRFLKAIAMIRDGRIGDVHTVTCDIGPGPESPVIPVASTPEGLNWEMWLGQAPWLNIAHWPNREEAIPSAVVITNSAGGTNTPGER